MRTFDGLTVDFCRTVGAGFLVRGLRAIADFEAELQLAHNNQQLAPDVDTVFFMTSLEHSYISSSLVKEIALFGGDVSERWLPEPAVGGPPACAARTVRARAAAARAIIPAIRPAGTTSRTGGRPLDIIFLVERLESLIANGKPLPLTRNAIIDRDAALNLIDELRVAVPEEVRAAKRINSEGERIIEKAQEEAERIVARAQEQAAFLIGERGLTEAAEAEGRRIMGSPPTRQRRIRRGADEYAAGVLAALEAEVSRTLSSIERGIAMLDERRGVPSRRRGRPGCSDGDWSSRTAVREGVEEGASPARVTIDRTSTTDGRVRIRSTSMETR